MKKNNYDVLVLSKGGDDEGYTVLSSALQKGVDKERIAVQSAVLKPQDKKGLQKSGVTPIEKFSGELGQFLHGVFGKIPR
jgi:hypothetical protein